MKRIKKNEDKNPAQIMLSRGEFEVIKLVSVMKGFGSVNLYLRHLVEKDVVEFKKTQENPWLFGGSEMNQYVWENLDDGEKERFINQIGPVKPAGFEYMVKKMQGRIYDDIPTMGDNELI